MFGPIYLLWSREKKNNSCNYMNNMKKRGGGGEQGAFIPPLLNDDHNIHTQHTHVRSLACLLVCTFTS